MRAAGVTGWRALRRTDEEAGSVRDPPSAQPRPPALGPAAVAVLCLQRSVGNRAVGQLLSTPPTATLQRTVPPGRATPFRVKGTWQGRAFEGEAISEFSDMFGSGYNVRLDEKYLPAFIGKDVIPVANESLDLAGSEPVATPGPTPETTAPTLAPPKSLPPKHASEPGRKERPEFRQKDEKKTPDPLRALDDMFTSAVKAEKTHYEGNLIEPGESVVIAHGKTEEKVRSTRIEKERESPELQRKRLLEQLAKARIELTKSLPASPAALRTAILKKVDDHEARLTKGGDADFPPELGRVVPLHNVGNPQSMTVTPNTLLLPGAAVGSTFGDYIVFDMEKGEIGRPQAGEKEFVILHAHPEWVLYGRGFHWQMTKGAEVAYAGHVCFDGKGGLLWWNNNTGHYKSHPGLAHQAQVAAIPGFGAILPLEKFKPEDWPKDLTKHLASPNDPSWPADKVAQLTKRFSEIKVDSNNPMPGCKQLATELATKEHMLTAIMVRDELEELGLIPRRDRPRPDLPILKDA